MKSRILKRKVRGPSKLEVRDYLRKEMLLTPAMANWVLGKKKRPANWTHLEVVEALILRKKAGQTAYQHMRKKLMMPLPSLTTLRRRIKGFRVERGMMDASLEIVRKHLEGEPEENRICAVSFDELSVCGDVSYDQQTDDVIPSSSKMQCIIIRGIRKAFKVPIFINFDIPMSPELLRSAISRSEEVGALVLTATCDFANDNQTLLKDLGVTMEDPFFEHPDDPERKVICMADPPHMVKRLRDHLWDQGYVLPDGKTKVMKKTLEDIFFEDRAEFQMLWKISERHLNCYGSERQRVFLATQVFSQSVAKVLRLNGQEDYAHFIETFDNFFDVANSTRKEEPVKTLKSGYGGEHTKQQKKVLDDTFTFVKKMRGITAKGNKKEALFPFQRGIGMICKGIPLLWSEIKKRYPGVKYILTARLNSDVVENFFSKVCVLNIYYRE